MEYTIDAQGKKLGRIASEAATVLRGKNDPSFTPNKIPGNVVKIVNASQVDLAGVKLEEKYMRYSGYPGGLKGETRGHLIKRRGYTPVFEHAVRGMLPSNRLRSELMKHLIIEE